jgi:two-component system, NarL family, nitrate/nitrite response regulator NarL
MGRPSQTPRARGRSGDLATVAVLGSSRVHRESVVASLARQTRLVVQDYGTGDSESLRQIARRKPDVVLIDLAPVAVPSIIQDVSMRSPTSRLLILGVDEADEEGVLALPEGIVCGLVPRGASLEDLIDAITRTVHGEFCCPLHLAAAMLRRLGARSPSGSRSTDRAPLTPREAQILRLIEQGLSNKEIASRLALASATIKNHIHNILEKFSVHRRSEAVARSRGDGPRLSVVDPKETDRRG